MAGMHPGGRLGPDGAECRAAIVAAGRRLGARGLISAGEGNVSVRLDGGRLLITPSGCRKDELAAEDLLVVPLAADPLPPGGPRPSSDVAIHRAIYEARSDVVAVVHAHLPAAMALTLAGEVPDPLVLPETALFLPRLPFLPFRQPGSDELARDVAAALTSGDEPLPGAVLLERHGAVAVGAGDSGPSGERGLVDDAVAAVDQAINRLELVEVLCRTWRDALLIRAATTGADGRAILRPPSPSPGAGRGRTT